MRGLGPWLAALLCAGAARAQDPKAPPPQTARAEAGKPLSAEDRELLKEMALLEKLELVRNLELFEPDNGEAPKPPPQRQP